MRPMVWIREQQCVMCPPQLARLLLLIASFLGGACSVDGRPPAFTSKPPRCPSEGDASAKLVYVFRYSWHTGLIVKRADVPAQSPLLLKQLPGGSYLEFSWGDEVYYQSENGGPLLALRAAGWPTSSVMHVAGIKSPHSVLSAASGALVEISMNDTAFLMLMDFLAAGFRRTTETEFLPLGPGLHGESRFFAAEGGFHLFRTCNTWTAEALQAASCPISPSMVITSKRLLIRARSFGRSVK